MAIQMIGVAAPYIASSVGSIIISASLVILVQKIMGWAEKSFSLNEPGPIGMCAYIIFLYGLGIVSSYTLTSVLLSNHSYATLAKVGNILLSIFGSAVGVFLEETIPDIPVNKAN